MLRAKVTILDYECSNAVYKFLTNREYSLVSECNLGKFYRYVNSKLVPKSGIGIIKDQQGAFTHDDKVKSDIFNEFFSSVFTVDDGHRPNVKQRMPVDCFTEISFSMEHIASAFRELRPKHSAGPDGLSAFLLKILSLVLVFL
jgi:hypothetical protein